MTTELRLFHDVPLVSNSLSVSGTIAHTEHKPPDPLAPLSKGVAVVAYEVKRTTLDPAKLGVGLNEGVQVVISRFYPLEDRAAAQAYIDAQEQAVRAELDRRRRRAMEQANGSPACELGPESDEYDTALRLAQ